MASVDSIRGGSVGPVTAGVAPAPPVNVDAEVTKCESDLSDWVHCPSSKTAAGKAKIAEITAKLDGLKAQMKRADEAKVQPQPLKSLEAPGHPLRFDLLGARLNAQA